MQLSKQQVETILKNAPAGSDKTKILDGLVTRGYELEGVDTQAAKQQIAVKAQAQVPVKPATTTDTFRAAGSEYAADAKAAFDNAGNRLNDAGVKIADTINDKNIPLADKVVKTGAEFFKGIGNFLGGGTVDIVKTLLPQHAEDYVAGKVKNVAELAAQTQPVQYLAQKYAALTPDERVGADNALGYAQGLSELLGVKSSGGLSSKLLDIAETGSQRLQKEVGEATVRTFDELKAATNNVKSSVRAIKDKFTGAQDAAYKATLNPETVGKRIATDPEFGRVVKEAQKQGFKEDDINFLAGVDEADKPAMKEMFDLAVKAQSDKRQIVRAGDRLGETVVDQVKQVQKLNNDAGQAVDEAAKSLKGVTVDATPLKENILSTLDSAGISMLDGGTLDFSNSVFKNTPKLQTEIQRVLSSVPDGSDAYQLHIFKKSIDELVNYGTTGEGLSGQSERILKSIRNSADTVLDNSFENYNKANTDYKFTRDFLEEAKGIVGRKVDLSTDEGKQAFGQALRSAFSNNKSRGATLSFIENTQKVGKQLKLTGAEQNVLEQAIFVTMLENTFGSEAATGLAGEVSKGIKTAAKGLDIIRNPVKGGLNAAADLIEKARGITPEGKKKILEAFINTQK